VKKSGWWGFCLNINTFLYKNTRKNLLNIYVI
jgi:hypothetical protein